MPRERIFYDPKLHSLWLILSRSIFSSVKRGHQLLIKELLESHDLLSDRYEELLKKFTQGKPLNEYLFKKLHKSKRALKQRPVARQEKKKKIKVYKPLEFRTSYNHILGHSQKHLSIVKHKRKQTHGLPLRQATIMASNKISTDDSHNFDSASLTSDDINRSQTQNQFQKGSTMMPKNFRSDMTGRAIPRAQNSKKVNFGSPTLDEIAENNSVSSSSREESDMPQINIEGPMLLKGSDNTSSVHRKSTVKPSDIQKQIQEHLHDSFSIEPPSDTHEQSPYGRFFLAKDTMMENDFTNLSQKQSEVNSQKLTDDGDNLAVTKKKIMAKRRGSKMNVGKKKKSLFKGIYPSNFAVYKEKTLRDVEQSSKTSSSSTESQIKEETHSESDNEKEKTEEKKRRLSKRDSSHSVKPKPKFKVGLIHKGGASKKKAKDIIQSQEVDISRLTKPKSEPITKRLRPTPKLGEVCDEKKNYDIILLKDTTETEAEDDKTRLEMLTKAVIEEKLAQLTEEMRGQLFNENALKQLDKRSSHPAISSSKIEAKMKKFQEKALMIQAQQRTKPGTPRLKSTGRVIRHEVPSNNLGLASNMTASPIGGTAPQTLNDSASNHEGTMDPPKLTFSKLGPTPLSLKKEHSQGLVPSRDRKAPIKIDVQIRKSTTNLYYGLSEADSDILAPIFKNKIYEQSQAEENYLNSEMSKSHYLRHKLNTLRTSSTNPGTIIKAKKDEEKSSVFEPDGANIYSDILASPMAAPLNSNGETAIALNQRQALLRQNLDKIKVATEKQVPRRFLKIMFDQKQLKQSALAKTNRTGHATSSDHRNKVRKILLSKTSEENKDIESALTMAGRTMGQNLNHDLESHFAAHTVQQPEKKLSDFRTSRPQTQAEVKRGSISPTSPLPLDRADFNIVNNITLFSKKDESAVASHPFKFSPKSSGLSSQYFWMHQNEKQEKANQQLSLNKFYPYAREVSASTSLSQPKRSAKNSYDDDASKKRRLSHYMDNNDVFPLEEETDEAGESSKVLAFSAIASSAKNSRHAKKDLVCKSRTAAERAFGSINSKDLEINRTNFISNACEGDRNLTYEPMSLNTGNLNNTASQNQSQVQTSSQAARSAHSKEGEPQYLAQSSPANQNDKVIVLPTDRSLIRPTTEDTSQVKSSTNFESAYMQRDTRRGETSISSLTRDYHLQNRVPDLKRILNTGRRSVGVLQRKKGKSTEFTNSQSNQVTLGTPFELTKSPPKDDRKLHKGFQSQIMGKWTVNKASSSSASVGQRNLKSQPSLLAPKRLLHQKAMANIMNAKKGPNTSMDNLYGESGRLGMKLMVHAETLNSESNELAKKTSSLSGGDEDIIKMNVRTSEIHQIYNSGPGLQKQLKKAPYLKENLRPAIAGNAFNMIQISDLNKERAQSSGADEGALPMNGFKLKFGSPSQPAAKLFERRKSQKFLIDRLSKKKEERRLVYLNNKSQTRLPNSAQPLSFFKQQYSGSQTGAESVRQMSGMKPKLTSMSDLRQLEGYKARLTQLAEPVLSKREMARDPYLV